MTDIIDFLISNSAWILVFAIVILLSVVGRYAEKTNFGFGNKLLDKSEEPIKEKEIDLSKKRLSEIIETKKDKSLQEEKVVDKDNLESNDNLKSDKLVTYNNYDTKNNYVNFNTFSDEGQSKENNDTINIKDEDTTESNTLEKKLQKLDEEFYEVLPKKEIIDDNILDSIDDISFDGKISKKKYMQSFNDIELPKIKSLKDEEIDIWKF